MDVSEVGNPFAIGSLRFEAAIEHVRSNRGDLPLTQIRWQATSSGACFESLQPHQSLDPVQAARQTFRQQVMPYPPGAIGPIARKKAGADPRAEFLLAAAASTARPFQPGIPRDTGCRPGSARADADDFTKLLRELVPCKSAAMRLCDRSQGINVAALWKCGATLAARQQDLGPRCVDVLKRYGQL